LLAFIENFSFVQKQNDGIKNKTFRTKSLKLPRHNNNNTHTLTKIEKLVITRKDN